MTVVDACIHSSSSFGPHHAVLRLGVRARVFVDRVSVGDGISAAQCALRAMVSVSDAVRH